MLLHTVLDWYQRLHVVQWFLQMLDSDVQYPVCNKLTHKQGHPRDDLTLISYGIGPHICPSQPKIGVALVIALCHFEPVDVPLLIALSACATISVRIVLHSVPVRHRLAPKTLTGAGTIIFILIVLPSDPVMPAAQWTTTEQYNWLQEQLPEYIALHSEDKDYTHFWAKTHLYWFKRWPEQAALFPDIPTETALMPEQQAAECAAEQRRKVQLRTWFHWRTNASKKNRGLKKEVSVFETALLPKSRAKSAEEIYMDMVYDERIKPLVKAEQEAGNVATAGHRMTLGRKFCKELLECESDEVKKEVREKYDKQKKVKKDTLDDEDSDNDESNADDIAKGIDDLPIICQRFARLIKKKTRFIVSFTCAGPDPRQNWDIVTLSCHPSETPAGSNFAQLCPDKDNTFLAAYQQYAELIFSLNKRNPLLPDIGDDNKTEDLGGCKNDETQDAEGDAEDAEEDAEDGEESEKGQDGDSIHWDNLGFASSSTEITDASPLDELNQSAFYSGAQFDASFEQAQPDASSGQAQPDASFRQAQPDASFGQALPDASLENAWHDIATMPLNPIGVLQSSVPGPTIDLGSSFSHANLMAMGYFGTNNTRNSFPPAFGSSAPSFTNANSTIGGHYDTQYDAHSWNLTNSESQGWEMPANPPGPDEEPQDLADTRTSAGLAKSKRKSKLKQPAAAKVKHNSAMEPTPTIAPTNTVKPKAKPKARPIAESSAITEMSHAAVDEGNTLVHSTGINTTAPKQNPVAQRASKRIPIRSKRNEVADAIGSDGLTFVGIAKEKTSVSEDVAATLKSTKRPANEGIVPAKKRRMKA
ncbi:hypothetical protein EDB19DRAFT_1908050 [Suillus lakei]|nr:hypothetical protein EDB19DRAFT_1908050 [Suillus lakei]